MAPPLASVLMLLILPLALDTNLDFGDDALARNAAIRAAFEDVPWRIGGTWFGQDARIPAAAEAILNPNAILCRRYREFGTTREATLYLVHCSDARDMQGHYPGVCYPNSGWVLQDTHVGGVLAPDESEPETWDCTWYSFNLERGEQMLELHVCSFFILPDGTVATGPSAVRRLAGRANLTTEGVAQVQIAFDGSVDSDARNETVRDLLRGSREALRALGLNAGEIP